ncbi:peroxiredoxin [Gilvibacter sediminis]|uniref:peroxiredoxin n=1 Tax=Gilvibacter sediminis TaxID=379071 RepID=UPI0023507470|nr:peroxiredoxin [Gilvibacter sediminis]MDC7998783.1 peroxiredoxin [Gilvibacter sediminis]
MALNIGDSLPAFELNDQNGDTFNSTQELKGQAAVIYFYPKNFTPGCNAEACSFRDHFEDFTNAGVRVIGISADSESSHAKFAKRFNLPFTLLADSKGKVRRMFDVKGSLLGILPGRETFVFNADGQLIKRFKALAADPHIRMALRELNKL